MEKEDRLIEEIATNEKINEITKKMHEEIINELEALEVEENPFKWKDIALRRTLSHMYVFLPENNDTFNISNNVSFKIDVNDYSNIINISKETQKEVLFNFSLIVDNKEYKGHYMYDYNKRHNAINPFKRFDLDKIENDERSKTYFDEECPYEVRFDFLTFGGPMLKLFVLEKEKHDLLEKYIKDNNIKKFEKLAGEIVSNSKNYFEEERVLLVTVNVCHDNNISTQVYCDILFDKIYPKSKYGLKIIRDYMLEDENTGIRFLDEKKRKINDLKKNVIDEMFYIDYLETHYQLQKKLHEKGSSVKDSMDNLIKRIDRKIEELSNEK